MNWYAFMILGEDNRINVGMTQAVSTGKCFHKLNQLYPNNRWVELHIVHDPITIHSFYEATIV